ncbi:MAG: hypothetical protein KF883_17060 [Thermomicrobiales bacterium]|nr:hypothetical protein [Thermomicrobiales bacterium]
MTIGRYAQRRDAPFFWWGTPYPPAKIKTLGELIADGTLPAPDAALSLLLLERGVSLFVISEASGAGKSSLLHALLVEATTDREPVYLRGGYETFDFLESANPARSILLVNEISPHLPAYLWGRPVRRLFEAMVAGFQVAGTAHAASPAEFLQTLIAPPLDVPAQLVMRPMLLIEMPGARTTGVLPGARPGSVVIEPLGETVSMSDRVRIVERMLDAASLPRGDIERDIAALLRRLP